MQSGRVSNAICLPHPDVAGRQPTLCAPSSTRSSTCCAPAARGATCQPIFRHGKPSSITDRALARSPGPGRSCCEHCTGPCRERQGRNPHRSRAIMDAASASRPSRSPLGSAALMPINTSRAVSGNGTVDTLGIPISIYVTPADVHDTKGARCLLAGLAFARPPSQKDLGRRGVSRPGSGRVVSCNRRVGAGSRGARDLPPAASALCHADGWWSAPRARITRLRSMSKDYERKVPAQ